MSINFVEQRKSSGIHLGQNLIQFLRLVTRPLCIKVIEEAKILFPLNEFSRMKVEKNLKMMKSSKTHNSKSLAQDR